MHKNCSKCGKKYPWGISAMDGICFPCRWSGYWGVKDQAHYADMLAIYKNEPPPKKATA